VQTAVSYLIDAISQGSIYALIALGLAVVFGLLGLVNFAHGDLVTVGAYALLVATAGLSMPFIGAVVLLVVVVVAGALIIERTVFRPARKSDATTLLVASFAVSYILQNLEFIIFSGRAKPVSLPEIFSGFIGLGSFRIPYLNLVTVALTICLLVGLRLFLSRTPLGIQMSAAAEDFPMARAVGVNANRVIASAFAISGVLAGTVSFILVAQLGNVNPLMGVLPVLIGFAAVVVGGMGSLVGATLGGFVLGFLSTILQAVLPLSIRPFRDAVLFVVVIVFLLIRPSGMIPGRIQTDRI
jgi:branched-chain amino acid transport system permease protein